MNRALQVGLFSLVVGVVLAVFTFGKVKTQFGLLPACAPLLVGLVLVIVGMVREVAAGRARSLEPEPARMRPRQELSRLLEGLRVVMMIAGACSAIAAATLYRVAIYDEEHPLLSTRAATA